MSIRLRRAILVRILVQRDGVDAAEPSIEIDIGTAPAAERTKLVDGWLAANRAAAGTFNAIRHGMHMVRAIRTGQTVRAHADLG